MSSTSKRLKNTVRLYTDTTRNKYWRVIFVNAKTSIRVPVDVTTSLLRRCVRGHPFECVYANGIMDYAEKNPDAFPHKVLHVYVIKRVIYIIVREDGVPTHAVRYFHDGGDAADAYDIGERQKLGPLILQLRPAKKRGGSEPPGARDRRRSDEQRNVDRRRRIPKSRGAALRALRAGYETPQRIGKKTRRTR